MSIDFAKNEIVKRISSPFTGSYILSLSILNWKIFTALFTGSIGPVERISLVETYVKECFFLYNFVIAFFLSIFYFYIVPYIEIIAKELKTGISIKINQKNNELGSKLINVEKYGISEDILGSALKSQLISTNSKLTELNRQADFDTRTVNWSTFVNYRNQANNLIDENNTILSQLSDIFNNSGNSLPAFIIRRAKDNRDNLKKIKK